MSITAEKIALDAAKLPRRVTDEDAHAIISGPEKWSFIKGYAYALLQQGEPEVALRKAYNKIEQHMLDYTHETHSYDASTNAWECSNGEVVAYVEGLDKALEIIKPMLSASPLPPAPGAEVDPSAEDCAKITAAQVGDQKLTPLSEPWGISSSRQAVLEEAKDSERAILLARVVGFAVGSAAAEEHAGLISEFERLGFVTRRKHYSKVGSWEAYALTDSGFDHLERIASRNLTQRCLRAHIFYLRNTTATPPAEGERK
jgi:hypothetical protein